MESHIREQRERFKRGERRKSRMAMAIVFASAAVFLTAQYIWMGEQGMASATRIGIIAASIVGACAIVGWALYRLVFKQDTRDRKVGIILPQSSPDEILFVPTRASFSKTELIAQQILKQIKSK